jgi:sec-independent protein translocase protein TatA
LDVVDRLLIGGNPLIEGLFQPLHLIIILVIIMIVFGAGKLPELGSGLGRGIKEFRREVHTETDEPPTSVVTTTPATPAVAASAPTAVSASCGSCGAALAAGAQFCGRCGASVTGAATQRAIS